MRAHPQIDAESRPILGDRVPGGSDGSVALDPVDIQTVPGYASGTPAQPRAVEGGDMGLPAQENQPPVDQRVDGGPGNGATSIGWFGASTRTSVVYSGATMSMQRSSGQV